MLAGCASTPVIHPVNRNLPEAPEFARKVAVPDPKAKESAIAVADRERRGRKRANAVIDKFIDWYNGVRQSYGAQ